MKKKEEPELYEDRKEKKSTNTAFILMFPTMILAGMAVVYSPFYGATLAIALAIYQFLMLKKFIEDYYKAR